MLKGVVAIFLTKCLVSSLIIHEIVTTDHNSVSQKSCFYSKLKLIQYGLDPLFTPTLMSEEGIEGSKRAGRGRGKRVLSPSLFLYLLSKGSMERESSEVCFIG